MNSELDNLYVHIQIYQRYIYTWVHPKSLSNLRAKQLSTIKPSALSVKFLHQDKSRECKFFAWFASDKVVW